MRLLTLSEGKTRNYGWMVIGTLLVIDAMSMGVTFTLGIMLPVISNDLGMSLKQAGWLGAMNWEVTAVFTLPLAFRFARFSPRKTVAISCACQVAMLCAQAIAPNYWLLLAARIGFMASRLISFSANSLLVQQWFPRNRFALVNTVSTVFSGLTGGTVVFFMGDLLGLFHGWRNIFFAFGAIDVLLLLAWLRLGREKPLPGPQDKLETSGEIKAVLKKRTLWLLGLGVTGDMLCFGAMETLWPKFATSLGFISLDKAANCEGLSYFGYVAGSLIGGLLSIKLGRRKPAIWISGLLLPFVTLGILFSRSFAWLAVLWTMWGIGSVVFGCHLIPPTFLTSSDQLL